MFLWKVAAHRVRVVPGADPSADLNPSIWQDIENYADHLALVKLGLISINIMDPIWSEMGSITSVDSTLAHNMLWGQHAPKMGPISSMNPCGLSW